jgi:DNA mismatch endonuclease (patch repair protein)
MTGKGRADPFWGSQAVDTAVSSRMRRVARRDTAPEMVIRKLLTAAGLRYRLHRHDLPGSPDIVFPGRRKVIFVHGCFWHRHARCARATMPKTRREYWATKFRRNVTRDRSAEASLRRNQWDVLTIWECECNVNSDRLLRKLASFFSS